MEHQYWTFEDIVSDARARGIEVEEHPLLGSVCDGGLTICKVCKSYEGGLTTDCPGEVVSYEKSGEVYAGKIDFRDGQWVEEKNPTNQTWERLKKARE